MSDLFGLTFADVIYGRHGVTQDSRHRFSKEIAQELREKWGEGAYLYCVEKLSNGASHPQLWRDVLTWLDEGAKDGINGLVSDNS